MNFLFKMPDLSTTGSPIKVLRWLFAVGEVVERGQAVLDVETDKATMEVEALNPGTLLEQMVAPGQEASAGEAPALFRQFEDRVKLLFLEGIMPGTIHQCQGQEATAVGVCAALTEIDFITSKL